MKNEITTEIDLRKVTKEYLTISVQVKNVLWVRIGLWFMKIGCWIGGFNFVDEFPMSLLQSDGEPYK